MGSDDADAAAAAPQQPQTQVSTLLRLLLKQQLRKLQKQSKVNSTCLNKRQTAEERVQIRSESHLGYQCPLGGKAVLEVEGALVAGHAVEQDLQDATEDALLRLCHRHRLQKKRKKTPLCIRFKE